MKSAVEKRHFLPVYFTKLVLVDLHNEDALSFLDYWYELTRDHQQDQVSFSLAWWKFGCVPVALPRIDVGNGSTYFAEMPHSSHQFIPAT
jgi:hypothetical protein